MARKKQITKTAKKTVRKGAGKKASQKVTAKTSAVDQFTKTAPATAEFISEFRAGLQGCLDQEVATSLVFSCTGVGPVHPSTKLGVLFPAPVQRRGFCGCVFNKAKMAGSNIQPSEIRCGATNTIGDVIDDISC